MSFVHGVQHGYNFKSNSVNMLIHYKMHGLSRDVPIWATAEMHNFSNIAATMSVGEALF